MSLHAKIAEAIGEIGRVPKNGWNAFHKYSYVREDDVVEAVRKALSSRGVAVYVSSRLVETREWRSPPSKNNPDGKPTLITHIQVDVTFADGESGETFTITSAGTGDDASDKGTYKAITGAVKYALMKTFLIPTGDDPEDTDHSSSAAAAPAAASDTATPEDWARVTEIGAVLTKHIGVDEANAAYQQLVGSRSVADLTHGDVKQVIAGLEKRLKEIATVVSQ